jgi:8-oxo-dGTP pyrophosphatase MutT (NUDIX family)
VSKEFRPFINQVKETLAKQNREVCLFPETLSASTDSSVVLCLLGECPNDKGMGAELCFVFNKRSKLVRQAGDLCFPGGGIVHHIDSLAAKFLGWPFLPLGRWPYWKQWRTRRRMEAGRLSILLATGLRESWEEIRLNPLRTEFLGPLPPQSLQNFQNFVYPMVVWIRNQKRFHPNQEVEKVVSIPVKDFLKSENYVRYQMRFEAYQGSNEEVIQDFPGFLHEDEEGPEVLWGLTYRIVLIFLEMLYDFSPPDIYTLDAVDGLRDETYFNSSSRKNIKKS